MNQPWRDILSYTLSILGRLLLPILARRFQKFSLFLAPDTPCLGTSWAVTFRDPLRSGGSQPNGIDASLQQYGRFVWGVGHVQGEPGDPFLYRGFIKRNVFYGSFSRKDSHVLAGTGTFVLKILSDSRRLEGRCSWYDKILDDVWSSGYAWTRKG